MTFEFDETKRLANIMNHRIDFRELPDVWDTRLEFCTSNRDGESRWIALLEINSNVVRVIYTQRAGNIRIISAHRARDHEKRAYRDIHRKT